MHRIRTRDGLVRRSRLACLRGLLLVSMLGLAGASAAHAEEATESAAPVAIEAGDAAAMAKFLDRLMLAESGGRDSARNPRSTALGPFQFIESTFLEVVQRHFASETATLDSAQILALRTDRAFARRVAEAFTRDNAARLAAQNITTTFANLRLAFFLGPGGAIRVLKADAQTPVINIVGIGVVQANPFMAGMTTSDLTRWSERNLAANDTARMRLALRPGQLAEIESPQPPKPAIKVRCVTTLPSCRRWIALAETKGQTNRYAARAGQKRAAATPRSSNRP